MKISWLVSALPSGSDGATSELASTRTRGILPVGALGERRPDAAIRLVDLDRSDPEALGGEDVVVCGKLFADRRPLLEAARRSGAALVLDLCDDVLSLPHLAPHYARALPLADALVCSTPELEQRMRRAVVKPCHCVPDVVEGERGPPAWEPGPGRLRLLFYGQPANLPPLRPALAELVRLPDMRCSVVVLTRWAAARAWFEELRAELGGRIDLELRQWSAEEQTAALEECDAVIVPSDGNPRRLVKTANRVTTALWAGKPCVAYPLPSYGEFTDYAWLDPSLARGVRRLLAAPAGEVEARCEAAQRRIEELHGGRAVAERWWEVIEGAAKARRPRRSSRSEVKLNLGCGDKLLEGYVNVDTVRERRSRRPDVLADVRRLAAFPDDHADEILAVHVIEHFHQWEAGDVLREWIRVLKPGRRLVLECPNLLSACEAVLRDPEKAARPGPEGQLSMWALFGDPSWRDPLMCHRWLYTPRTLAELMSACGLVDISQRPAEFKLREPRDMRLVGYKPGPS